MTEQIKPTYDVAISDMVRALISDLVDEAQQLGHGETPREKIRSHLKFNAGENLLHGITALSGYIQARASERQAAALESLAKTAGKLQVAESLELGGQAIVDQRESKRDYLATTYSLPTETLSLLWAMRGMLMDASVKSLSRPDRFDAYRRVRTEEIAWSLRLTPGVFVSMLPRTESGIDYALLEEFDVMRYGGTDDLPDDWMYGG